MGGPARISAKTWAGRPAFQRRHGRAAHAMSVLRSLLTCGLKLREDCLGFRCADQTIASLVSRGFQTAAKVASPAPKGPRTVATGEAKRNPWEKVERCLAPAGQRRRDAGERLPHLLCPIGKVR